VPKKPGVSLCMIVKDEEAMLPDCLASVRDVVDEIVVVDTGSSDRTVEIARTHGARVDRFAWNDSFSDARNHSLALCEREWALLLDADERLMPEDIQKLRDLTASSDADGAHFKVLNYLGDSPGHQYTLHNALRLLRNSGEYRFAGDIHEQIVRADGAPVTGHFALTDIRLVHLGYLDGVTALKDKRSRNLALLERALQEKPDDPFTLFNLGNEYMAAKAYEKAAGFYDRAFARYDPNQAYAPHLLFRRAMCAYQLGRLQEAIRALDEGLRAYPGCTDMQCLKGQIHMDQHRDLLAVECLERAIEMGEPHPTLKFLDGCATTRPFAALALICKRQAHYAKACMYFGRAIASDNTLHFALYEAAECLVRLGLAPDDIEKNLSSLFDDPLNPANLILLTDVMLSQRLMKSSDRLLKSLEQVEGYEMEKALLSGKRSFWAKEYDQALRLAKRAHELGAPRVLVRGREDAALTLAAGALILGGEDALSDAREAISQRFGREAGLVFDQMCAMRRGDGRHHLDGVDPDRATTLACALLGHVLKAGEFDVFESLLYVFNHIDSPNVLIALAALYRDCGRPQMAADAVLRSIRELNAITPEGARILAETLPGGPPAAG